MTNQQYRRAQAILHLIARIMQDVDLDAMQAALSVAQASGGDMNDVEQFRRVVRDAKDWIPEDWIIEDTLPEAA